MKDIIDLLGRIFLGVISLYQALDTVFFYGQAKETMNTYGITFLQDTLLIGGIITLFIGSIMVLLGYYAKLGSWILIIYWLPATLIIYSFWNDEPSTQGLNAFNFMQSLGYIGGLLILAANGAGNISVRRLLYVMKLPK